MKLPESVWTNDLGEGSNLLTRIGLVEPTFYPIIDLSAFKNGWKQRLSDAKARDLPEMISKSQKILSFIADYDEIVMLIWPDLRLTALYAPKSEKIIIME